MDFCTVCRLSNIGSPDVVLKFLNVLCIFGWTGGGFCRGVGSCGCPCGPCGPCDSRRGGSRGGGSCGATSGPLYGIIVAFICGGPTG